VGGKVNVIKKSSQQKKGRERGGKEEREEGLDMRFHGRQKAKERGGNSNNFYLLKKKENVLAAISEGGKRKKEKEDVRFGYGKLVRERRKSSTTIVLDAKEKEKNWDLANMRGDEGKKKKKDWNAMCTDRLEEEKSYLRGAAVQEGEGGEKVKRPYIDFACCSLGGKEGGTLEYHL